jgi:hypothetical protein
MTSLRRYAYIYALFYALCFAFFPWESLTPLEEFVDKANYLKMFNYFSDGMNYHVFENTSILSWVSNELVWAHFLNYAAQSGWNFNIFTSLVSTFIVFTYFLFIISETKLLNFKYLFVVSILFINPIFVDIAISQLRSAFAMSIFLFFIFLYRKTNIKIFEFLIFLTPAIHTVSVLFLIIYFGYKLISFKYQDKRRKIYPYVLGVVAGIIMSTAWYYILDYFGDRRAIYSDMSSSFSYMSFWIITSFALLFIKLKDSTSTLIVFIFFFFAGIFTVNTVFGAYASRFVALAYMSIVYLFLNIENKSYRSLIFLGYFLFCSIQWFYWLT